MDDREPSEVSDPQATQVPADRRDDRQPKLVYAVFEIDQETLRAEGLRQEGDAETRQVTILHTSYGRGLVYPAEDRSCPT